MRCLASFLWELCRFSLLASSVCVRVSYAGLKRVPLYPDVWPAPLVRLLCPPDEPHAVLSQPFLHSWGHRPPARPRGQPFPQGAHCFPGEHRAKRPGQGLDCPCAWASGPPELGDRVCTHVCNYRHTRARPSLSPPGRARG